MRENPWHLRHPTTVHFQWFRNLIEFHQLTVEWVTKLHPKPPECGFFAPKDLGESVYLLSLLNPSLPEANLEDLIQEVSPEEFLGRFQHSVWKVQGYSIEALFQGISAEDVGPMESSLEEIAVKRGATCAQTRWQHLSSKYTETLPSLFEILGDSPFSGTPKQSPFLWKRVADQRAEADLLLCPHQLPYPEVKGVAQALCHLHSQWMLGYILALNPNAKMKYQFKIPRCSQQWSLERFS